MLEVCGEKCMEMFTSVTEWIFNDLPRYEDTVKVVTMEGIEAPVIRWAVFFDVTCKYMDKYKHHVLETYKETMLMKSIEVVEVKEMTPFGINHVLFDHGFHAKRKAANTVKDDL